MFINIKNDLAKYGNPEKKEILQRFFKTGPGQYGEGDVFIGAKVPEIRSVAKKHKDAPLSDVQTLLKSKIHEERLCALLMLVERFKETPKDIYDFYIRNTKHINNWDLVDLTADKIVGAYLFDKDRSILFKLAKSYNLWERRIAVLATFHFIKNKDTEDAFKIYEILLHDKHDLIHKAVGWMLRELGKRVSQEEEEKFLKKYYKKMPRTMLRYAIERFDKEKKEFYMKR